HGAGHQQGRRAGTESAMLCAAIGAACALAADLTANERIRELRDSLWNGLLARFGDSVRLNGHPTHRLPNTLNVSFLGRLGAEVLAGVPGIAASTGSACHSDRIEVSPVLSAMGVSPQVACGAVRFSLGRGTTPEEIDGALTALSRSLAS